MRRESLCCRIVLATLVVVGGYRTARADDVQAAADLIDRHIAARWKSDGVVPTEVSDDAEFFRRINLHIGGVIPTVWEVRSFVADPSPDKRRQAVEHLLSGPRYIAHFTSTWRKVMLPETETDPNLRGLAPEFENWLRKRLIDNTSYDRMVRELLTAPLSRSNAMAMGNTGREATPAGFFAAKEMKPENLAAGSARTFLGVRIDCAQCHDHPFDAWKRQQFWGYAAFFAGIVPARAGSDDIPVQQSVEVFDRRELAIPDDLNQRVVQATFLNGDQPDWKPRTSSRQTLAEWITARDNPYFARATVNRLWAHFFGLGLVDPVDDLSPANIPSHPELLNELGREFARHDFDLQFLIRAIVNSRTYQLTSRRTHDSQDDPTRFARMAVQGLTAESVYRSLQRATGAAPPAVTDRSVVLFAPQGEDQQFRELFANVTERPIDRQTSILQALLIMNGPQTDVRQLRILESILAFPDLTAAEQIETLFLSTVSRLPAAAESARLVQAFEAQASPDERRKVLGDILWALLNSSEFLFNH